KQNNIRTTKTEDFGIIFSHPLVSPSPARRRQKRLPQCLIIGVRKGGTRALLDALALQPYIRIARQEMHFFNDNETYAKGSEWYRQQMPYTYPEQCLIIGVRKGGTRALLDALALQPYIRIARQEMHFFNDNETYAKGSEWYRQQMPYTYPEQVSFSQMSTTSVSQYIFYDSIF
ncbi:unnamed protein product, partial [Gongylonema pulchrum]|uniref:Sulfotransfer_1 domain-containing protein n=1 Tax=Gongylonema pulchrum TaxID=637853 RepID=A0A183EY68_9BILA